MERIIFKANKNTVTANKYVPYALYTQNEEIVEELGGEIERGAGKFKAHFPTAAKAKAFVEQAVTSISKKEYNASRKVKASATEPKKAVKGKGKSTTSKGKYITLTDEDGNEYKVPMSALGITPTPKKATTKGKTKTQTKAKKGKGKGCAVDFSKYASKGKAANSQVATLIRKAGYTDKASFDAMWVEWVKVRG